MMQDAVEKKKGRPKKAEVEAMTPKSSPVIKSKETVKPAKTASVAKPAKQKSPVAALSKQASRPTSPASKPPGPMTTKIIQEVQKLQQSPSPLPTNGPSDATIPNATLNSASLLRTSPLSTPQHQLAAMSTKSKPPPTTSAAPKPSPSSKILKDINRLAIDSAAHPIKATRSPDTAPRHYTQKQYNSAARRYTAILVSLPLVLVSSWWLYERLVLGKEQKAFPITPLGSGDGDLGDHREK
jgi:hypothetical protein